MDTLELRNHYAMMTGDTKGAYAVREDDKEGYLYSDEMRVSNCPMIVMSRLWIDTFRSMAHKKAQL